MATQLVRVKNIKPKYSTALKNPKYYIARQIFCCFHAARLIMEFNAVFVPLVD
jgi:hypothetical protein